MDLLVVLTSQKTMILEGCHSAILGVGHFGRDKTLEKLSKRYYCKEMVNDVKNFCKYCDRCQRANRAFEKHSAELHPIKVKDEVWSTVGIDLIGPLPLTERQNKYIITATCLFSK
ncbi:uncharacterized protein LOC136092002 [Hydra vulgaris]|uniref:Uncharacterized protein LOC136092002 n=1 Tax=Hydra vulgaris TaxID=6087 RepID=A0ABM4DMK8_HYDVU